MCTEVARWVPPPAHTGDGDAPHGGRRARLPRASQPSADARGSASGGSEEDSLAGARPVVDDPEALPGELDELAHLASEAYRIGGFSKSALAAEQGDPAVAVQVTGLWRLYTIARWNGYKRVSGQVRNWLPSALVAPGVGRPQGMGAYGAPPQSQGRWEVALQVDREREVGAASATWLTYPPAVGEGGGCGVTICVSDLRELRERGELTPAMMALCVRALRHTMTPAERARAELCPPDLLPLLEQRPDGGPSDELDAHWLRVRGLLAAHEPSREVRGASSAAGGVEVSELMLVPECVESADGSSPPSWRVYVVVNGLQAALAAPEYSGLLGAMADVPEVDELGHRNGTLDAAACGARLGADDAVRLQRGETSRARQRALDLAVEGQRAAQVGVHAAAAGVGKVIVLDPHPDQNRLVDTSLVRKAALLQELVEHRIALQCLMDNDASRLFVPLGSWTVTAVARIERAPRAGSTGLLVLGSLEVLSTSARREDEVCLRAIVPPSPFRCPDVLHPRPAEPGLTEVRPLHPSRLRRQMTQPCGQLPCRLWPRAPPSVQGWRSGRVQTTVPSWACRCLAQLLRSTGHATRRCGCTARARRKRARSPLAQPWTSPPFMRSAGQQLWVGAAVVGPCAAAGR